MSKKHTRYLRIIKDKSMNRVPINLRIEFKLYKTSCIFDVVNKWACILTAEI